MPDSGEDLQELHLGSLRFKAPARLVPSSTPVAGGAVVEPGRGLLGLGQKSSSSVDAKEQPTVHHGHPSPALHHQPFGAGGGTEDRRAGKMDHYLLGDPSVGPSDAKGKGRVESDEEAVRKPSKGLDPSSKLFVPEGAHVVAPSATRRAGGPVPEDPVQVPAPVVQSGRSSRPLPPIPEVGRPPAATATITGVRPTPGSSMAAQTRSTDLAAPRLTPGSNLTAEPVHSVSNNPSRGPGGAAAPSSSNNNHAHSSGASSCEVECALEGCEARCRLWDEAAIICPRCGPHVEVRYCVQGHLHEDVKMHWVWCGQMAVARPCREDLIPSRLAREAVPMVPCLHGWDSPERHRQAVRFADGGLAGDYFVFADWADLGAAGYPSDRLLLRCSFRVVETVRFDDPEERDRFRRVLAVCLFCEYPFLLSFLPSHFTIPKLTYHAASVENVGLVDFLFRLIRDALRSRGAWSPDTDMAVRYQFQSELSVTIRTEITGERHACVGDWEGLNPRHCRDPVCRSERRYFLGDPGRGRGYRRLVEHMEASYWVLRAARTTHPRVTETVARMRGEGFSDVVEEEKREFRRGPGWDGAGAGDMEIEGINA